MRPLTDKQRAVLDFINSKKFVPPTIRQVAKEFSISTSSAFENIKALQKKGALPG